MDVKAPEMYERNRLLLKGSWGLFCIWLPTNFRRSIEKSWSRSFRKQKPSSHVTESLNRSYSHVTQHLNCSPRQSWVLSHRGGSHFIVAFAHLPSQVRPNEFKIACLLVYCTHPSLTRPFAALIQQQIEAWSWSSMRHAVRELNDRRDQKLPPDELTQWQYVGWNTLIRFGSISSWCVFIESCLPIR